MFTEGASERERRETLFEIRTWEFTNAHTTINIPGEAPYYMIEILVMWSDVGWDVEHIYLFN
jgi:hypothetical protein